MPYPSNTSFDPLEAHSYSVDELIDFMKKEKITLREINNVRHVPLFSFRDLCKFLENEVCQVNDMDACGVPPATLKQLREWVMINSIVRREWEEAQSSGDEKKIKEFMDNYPDSIHYKEAEALHKKLTDDKDWEEAQMRHTLGAYAIYIRNHKDGKYIEEATRRYKELLEEETNITAELIEDMKKRPWIYPPTVMSALLKGGIPLSPEESRPKNDDHLPVHERFLARGFKLKFDQLIANNVIPEGFTSEIVLRPEYSLPQTADFDNFPLNRTDVFFLGVPRSGKSTVLSSLFYAMYREGRWRHQVNINPRTGVDPSLQYYHGLLRAVKAHKPPESTATDTISYISMDVPAGENRTRTAKLNFVEISGEAVNGLAQSIAPGQNANAVWRELGASNVMANNNTKILFFLLDYNTIANAGEGEDVLNQELTLNTVLHVLTNDGKGKDNSNGCTLSKVESVAILLTKCDLMETSDEQERQNIAMEYLQQNFRGFMNTLENYCQRFRINDNNQNRPLIFTFSAGKFFVGNTLLFDDYDARRLASRIEGLAPYRSGGPF